MKARLSPKHVIALLLAVLVTAGFSLSAAQASAMSAKMAMTPSMSMSMLGDTNITTLGLSAAGDCAACQKGSGDNGNPMHCPPVCVAPVLAMLPQAFELNLMKPTAQLFAWHYPLLSGRNSVPDPSPPKSSILA